MVPGSLIIVGDIFQLSGLQLRLPDSLPSHEELPPSATPKPITPRIEPQSSYLASSSTLSLTCHACGVGTQNSLPFSSLAEQRNHFRSDWHRLNVKRKLLNQPAISEEEFATTVIADDVSSLSGSSSEEEEDWPLGIVKEEDIDEPEDKVVATSQVPQFVFSSPDGRLLAVWRCLLIPDQTRSAIVSSSSQEQLERLNSLISPAQANKQTWIIVMLRGGHFAAAVCRAKPSSLSISVPSGSDNKKQGVAQKPDAAAAPFEIVTHKTFHRYVVRAKAGGKQSSKDGSKSIHSAGSSLRRYNESALEKDIQDLLSSWSPHLASAQLVFVHAPSSNARSIFSPSGSGESLLSSSDPRVRRVPFMTQRPTFSELKRVLGLLSSLYELPTIPSESTQDGNKEVAEGGKDRPVVGGNLCKPQRPQQTSEADSDEDEENDAVEESPMGPSTALHRAARSGDNDLVSFLLETGCDPTVRDEFGKTAYKLSSDKAVRDTFRKFMAREPDMWNWRSAGVPSALTEELEASHQAKKAEKRAKFKAKAKAKKKEGTEAEEARRKLEEAEAALAVEREVALAAAAAKELASRLNIQPSKKVGPGRGRGSGGGPARGGGRGQPQQQQQQAQPLTPEEMARRRALQAEAAEARMKALTQASMQQKLH